MGDGVDLLVDGNVSNETVSKGDAEYFSIAPPTEYSSTASSSIKKRALNGFNLGTRVVQKKFDGFIGLAKIVRHSQEENDMRFPIIYDHKSHVSMEELLKINSDDIVDMKHYEFCPNTEIDVNCDDFYKAFENDLLNFGMCKQRYAFRYSFAVAEALRTQKNFEVPKDSIIKVYALLTKSKEIFLLYCNRKNHDHLLHD